MSGCSPLLWSMDMPVLVRTLLSVLYTWHPTVNIDLKSVWIQGPIFLLEYVIKKLIQKNSEVLLSISWPKECAIMIYYWKGNRKYTMPVWASTTSDLTRLDLATLIRWLHSCSLPIHVSLDILELRVYCLSSSWDPGPPACGAFSEHPNGSDST
jgi:hypothetical protein